MRTHSDIVTGRGATNLRRDLESLGLSVSGSTPQRWAERDSIPPEYWESIVGLGLATLEELAKAAANRKGVAA